MAGDKVSYSDDLVDVNKRDAVTSARKLAARRTLRLAIPKMENPQTLRSVKITSMSPDTLNNNSILPDKRFVRLIHQTPTPTVGKTNLLCNNESYLCNK